MADLELCEILCHSEGFHIGGPFLSYANVKVHAADANFVRIVVTIRGEVYLCGHH